LQKQKERLQHNRPQEECNPKDCEQKRKRKITDDTFKDSAKFKDDINGEISG
jgi:hypothetical protein